VCQERCKTQSATETRSVEETEATQTDLERIGAETHVTEKEATDFTAGWISKYSLATTDWFPRVEDIWIEWITLKRWFWSTKDSTTTYNQGRGSNQCRL